MKTKKQIPRVNLQKSSILFMQLGLIFALFSVYLIIEMESDYTPKVFAEMIYEDDEITTIGPVVVEPDEPKSKPITKPKEVEPIVKTPKILVNIQVVDNTSKVKEADTAPTEVEPDEPITPVKQPVVIAQTPPKKKEEGPININIIQHAPEYPGCTGSKAEKRACFNKKIHRLVKRKFDTELAQTLGLEAGTKRIAVQFIIDENGDITNIKVRAPHKRLEKEAKRIINLLPKMKPGRQGDNTAKVKFNLPIVFNVED